MLTCHKKFQYQVINQKNEESDYRGTRNQKMG
jgi:hypothetical protein